MFMNSIIDIADSLITDVIENPSLGDIRFLKAYGASNYNPSYEGFTAVVNIDEVKRSGGFVSRLYKTNTYGEAFSAELRVRLYAGSEVSGDSLTRNAVALREAVISADSYGFIDNSRISPIEYESGSGALYRELSFYLEYVLCEAIV